MLNLGNTERRHVGDRETKKDGKKYRICTGYISRALLWRKREDEREGMTDSGRRE